MKKSFALMLVLSISFLALGIAIGYCYRDRSVAYANYDGYLADLGSAILMMDAHQHKKDEIIGDMLSAEIEGKVSGFVLLYDRYKFGGDEYIRCVVTRKARALYEDKKILVSREQLEAQGYPYNQVKAYLVANCSGKPSHSDWTNVPNSAGDKTPAIQPKP